MNLSTHFELSEFTTSETADRLGIDNAPPEWAIDRLQNLCVKILEPLRAALGTVLITSGYRCPALNKAVGGSATSSHMEGKAADLHVKGRSLAEVFNWLLAHKELGWDQLIREFEPRGWIHISYDSMRSRGVGLMASRGSNGKVIYRAQDTPIQV